MFFCFDAWISRNPSRGPNTVYVYEPQQNLGWGCTCVKTDLSTYPVIYYWPFQGGVSDEVYYNCLSVGLWLFFIFFLFRIAWWLSAGKELFSRFSVLAVYFVPSKMCPIWSLGQDVEIDCIGSWLLPFHLLCFDTPINYYRVFFVNICLTRFVPKVRGLP